MPRLSKMFDKNNWRLPLTIGNIEEDAKKIRIRWYKKDGSTESDPPIDVSSDGSYKYKLIEAIEKRKSDKFRIETLDESGKQIGSESFSPPDPAAPPPATPIQPLDSTDAPQEIAPMPDAPSAPPAPPVPASPSVTPSMPTIRNERLPVDEIQKEAFTNTLLCRLLESQTNNSQRTLEKLLESNGRMIEALLREKSGTQYVEKLLELIDQKEKALERATMAEAALAVETNRPK